MNEEHNLIWFGRRLICTKCDNASLECKPDRKADGSGLDDGPYLPGEAPRRKGNR